MRLLSIGEVMIEMSGGWHGSSESEAWRLGFAGDTLNTLWYVRAGLDPERDEASYFTTLGDDGFSDRIAEFLGSNGIEIGAIRRIPGKRPGLYLIEQKDGDRRFTYWRDTSAARQLADDEDALRQAIASADCIYLSGITLAILPAAGRALLVDLCGEANSAGKTVAFDPNIRPALWSGLEDAREAVMRLAAAATIVLPSFDDETAVFGDADPQTTIERYRAAGVAEIAVKNGPHAIAFCSNDEEGTVDALPNVKPVDATGAGDSFNGAYLGARLTGASMREAVEAGRDMAARVVGVHGALADFADPSGRWSAKRG
ncbi:2-dehydro-3-deoxygluconokinase protein [Fulvimarina pelagi HTCC2506]|uniref:2-dehydro-3-deoxygluconokinase protein n=2 Tax=Fulvimarina pelagi TaxID=217511 RepID=Q0G1K2_9HYPH|nr:sugar kinase [Fulvimarina pelagi]EAU41079.1 2-dehydro-3-deoxygluconokinase protein [Fulvimarina pelagi HTCC2506]BAT30907.1 2-dehydro-3-deoxygluconokinase protein [Fulvimarina pelagi]